MKTTCTVIFASAAFTLIGLPLVMAHPTGHESRTVAQCERLPTPERQACIACVKRPIKHHYHPDYPAGKRCRPDNGKP
jgi:hypothetical protein